MDMSFVKVWFFRYDITRNNDRQSRWIRIMKSRMKRKKRLLFSRLKQKYHDLANFKRDKNILLYKTADDRWLPLLKTQGDRWEVVEDCQVDSWDQVLGITSVIFMEGRCGYDLRDLAKDNENLIQTLRRLMTSGTPREAKNNGCVAIISSHLTKKSKTDWYDHPITAGSIVQLNNSSEYWRVEFIMNDVYFKK